MKYKFSSVLNWLLTIGWLIFICCLWLFQGLEKPKTLNELGDFIAGAFAPLAFFWLVRGFYQQGKGLEQNSIALNMQAEELQLSTQALMSQVEEMKAAVDQQKILAELQRIEIEERHKAVEPVMDIHVRLISTMLGNNGIEFTIHNMDHNFAKNTVIYMNLADMNDDGSVKIFDNFALSTRVVFDSFTETEKIIFSQNSIFERYIELKYENIYGRVYSESYILEVSNYENSEKCRIYAN